jgi:hypothetical protein
VELSEDVELSERASCIVVPTKAFAAWSRPQYRTHQRPKNAGNDRRHPQHGAGARNLDARGRESIWLNDLARLGAVVKQMKLEPQ